MKPPITVCRAAACALAAATLLASAPARAQTPSQTLHLRSLAATCANCHGTDGHAVPGDAMARLAGVDAGYLADQLRAFRDGKRPATVMHQLTKGYSDEQIAALAAYFAAQPAASK